MSGLLWIVTAIGGVVGGIELFFALGAATSAPQQAAGAAIAMGYVVIPYCLARAAEGLERIMKANKAFDDLAAIRQALAPAAEDAPKPLMAGGQRPVPHPEITAPDKPYF